MRPKMKAHASFELMGVELFASMDVEITYLGCPAKLSGPPEKCWPQEPPEYEVTGISVQMDGYPYAGPKWLVEPRTAQFKFLAEFFDDEIYPQVAEFLAERRSYRRQSYVQPLRF